MSLYITYASYSQAGAKGLLAKPEDRTAAIQKLVDQIGGKIVGIYFTTGRNDIVLITDAPDGTDVVAVGMAVAASGAISNIETVKAWSASEFKGIAEKAASLAAGYAPPGS